MSTPPGSVDGRSGPPAGWRSTRALVALAVLFAAAATWRWLPSRPGPLPYRAVDPDGLPAATEPLVPETIGVPAEVGDLLAATAAMPASELVPSAGREWPAEFVRTKHDFAHLMRVTPTAAKTDQLVRCVSLNPRDTWLDAEQIGVLRRVIDAYEEQLARLAELEGRERNRLVVELARQGRLVAAEDVVARYVHDGDRAEIDRMIAGARAQSAGITDEQLRSSIVLGLAARRFGTDTTFSHKGATYVVPPGVLDPDLQHFRDYRDYLAAQMLGAVVTLFQCFGALTPAEADALFRRYQTG
jgi:hypothetical protein